MEDMLGYGVEMWNKLGVPAQRVEAELRKIQSVAGNMQLATGFLGLEQSLQRLLPIVAKLQGGQTRAGATLGQIQKMGYGKDVSEEIFQRIFGSLTDEQEHLIRQAARHAGYRGSPIGHDMQGRPVITRGGLKALQRYVRKKPLYGAGMYFGGGMMGNMPMMGRMRGAAWTVNGTPIGEHDHRPILSFARGHSCVLELVNDTQWHHPIHLHGHVFRVISRDGRPTRHREWLDTVLLDPRERVEIAFVADNPGDWMFHCHNLEHQLGGMMALVRVS